MDSRAGNIILAGLIVLVLTFGLTVGPYWIDDAIVLALLAFAVVVFCLREGVSALWSWFFPSPRERQTRYASYGKDIPDMRYREYAPRSRVARYVALSRIDSIPSTTLESYEEFERALLGRKGWQNLTEDQLRDVIGAASNVRAG